jgi:hypothetical protein
VGKTFAFNVEPAREIREKSCKEPGLAQEVAALGRLSREEDFERLLVETRRRCPDNGFSGGDSALRVLSSMVKASRAANRTARSIRTGSSWKRTAGSPMVRMMPALRSARPPV